MAKKRGTAKVGGNTPKIDYEEAFIYYCTPDEDGRLKSYADVARHFNISERIIEKWGSRKSWVKRRESIGKRKVSQWTEEQAKLATEINQHLFEKWRKMLTLLGFELDDIDISQMLTYGTDGKKSDIRRAKARDYKEFSEALKNTTDKLRILTGQTTDYTKSDIDATVAKQLDSEELNKIDNYLNKLNEDRKPSTKNTVPNEPAKD